MKLAVAILLASLSLGQGYALKAINGVLPEFPSARQLQERSGCNNDNVLRGLKNPKSSADASSFCSFYLQPTSTVTQYYNVSQTLVSTQTTTNTEFDTITKSSPTITTTALCAAAIPTTEVSCGVQAYGYVSFLISETPDFSPIDCHVSCLAIPSCKSFQSQILEGDNGYCNLYNTSVAGNVSPAPEEGYFFYDRECQEFRPSACSGFLNVGKRSVSIPGPLATIPTNRINSACSCLITSAPLATTSVILLEKTVYFTSTVVVTKISTYFDTVVVGETVTIISTVAP